MASILVKGKTVHLDDEIVRAGDDVIRMALAASFPDAATMDFTVVGEQAARVTERHTAAVISSRSSATTKG